MLDIHIFMEETFNKRDQSCNIVFKHISVNNKNVLRLEENIPDTTPHVECVGLTEEGH